MSFFGLIELWFELYKESDTEKYDIPFCFYYDNKTIYSCVSPLRIAIINISLGCLNKHIMKYLGLENDRQEHVSTEA